MTGLRQDVDLYLLTTDGRELARSWNGNASPESIRVSLEADEYVVLVKPWGNAESAYSLSLETAPDQPAPAPIPEDPPSVDAPYPDVPDFGGADDWNLNRTGALTQPSLNQDTIREFIGSLPS